MEAFGLCFIQLFVAVDAIGGLPTYLGLTEGLPPDRQRRIILQSMATALAVGLAFLFGGRLVLDWIRVRDHDFMVAGGALLFILAVRDLLVEKQAGPPVDPETVGAVPIGVPLIVGPGVLATMTLLVTHLGLWPTVLATAANVLVAGAIFLASGRISRLLGRAGMRTVSKIAMLVLASIGVMMVRHGLVRIIQSWPGS